MSASLYYECVPGMRYPFGVWLYKCSRIVNMHEIYHADDALGYTPSLAETFSE